MVEFDYEAEYQKAIGIIRDQAIEIATLRRKFADLMRWRNAVAAFVPANLLEAAWIGDDAENHTVGMSAVEERG